MLLAQHADAAEVDEHVRRAQRLGEPAGAHPVHLAGDGGVAKRPALAEPVSARSSPRSRRTAPLASSVTVSQVGVVRPLAGVLDVGDLVAEAAEALEVVQHLPGDAGERHLGERAEHDDRGSGQPSSRAGRVGGRAGQQRAQLGEAPAFGRMPRLVAEEARGEIVGQRGQQMVGAELGAVGAQRAQLARQDRGARRSRRPARSAATPNARGSRPQRSSGRPRAAAAATRSGTSSGGQHGLEQRAGAGASRRGGARRRSRRVATWSGWP